MNFKLKENSWFYKSKPIHIVLDELPSDGF